MDAAAFEFLLTAVGQALLVEAEGASGSAAELSVGRQLRAAHDPAYVAAAMTQVDLRRRARDKLGADAERMYFTRAGLEQATAGAVAAHRAGRVVALGHQSLLDLGCGVGSDLVAAARRGLRVLGVDADPVTAAVAAANLAALELPGTVLSAMAEEQPRDGHDIVFADPARRGPRGRVFDPSSYSPPWSFVAELLTGSAVVKVAPGIPHELVPDDVEAEWVSLDGHLREAALWSRRPDDVRRRATVLRSDGSADSLTDADPAPPSAVPDVRVGAFVYEPDDAVVRAHLVTTVSTAVDGWLLDPHLAYVSSDREVRTPFARAYAVLAVLPFRVKLLRAALRERDIGPLTIKKRGVQVTPEELRKRLALAGSKPATLIVTRTPTTAVVLLVDPLP